MPLISTLESRFGRFAVRGLIQIIAGFQLLTLLLFYLSGEVFLDYLRLRPDRVLSGEVWRLVSWIFVPESRTLIWGLIGAWFMMWIGRGLEEAWGAFRVNVYVIGGIAAMTAGALIFGYTGSGFWLFQTLLFAFAVFYPNEEILLFFILPVKIKWVAMLSAAMMFFVFIGDAGQRWPIVFANLNFVIAFLPAFIKHGAQRARVMERRQRFEAASTPQDAFLHKCSTCGKTELDDPGLEFRVSESGDEYCHVCRLKRDKTEAVS